MPKFLNPVRCLLSKRGKYLRNNNIETNISIFLLLDYTKNCSEVKRNDWLNG